MFGSLFIKECKQILKSLIFYLYVVLLVLFYMTQMGESNLPNKPQPGAASYGYKNASDEQAIMEGSLGKMVYETANETYLAYPFGFYRPVKLNDKEKAEMLAILKEASGHEWESLEEKMNYFNEEREKELSKNDQLGIEANMVSGQYWPNIKVKEGLNYQAFEELMKKADKLIGGGSAYAPSSLSNNAEVPITYEEAVVSYEAIFEKDGVTGAMARLFCDYMGILLGVLPVFLAVTRGLRDRRAQADAVIYARKASSLCIIGARYLATLMMCVVPLVVLGISPTLESVYLGNSMKASVDILGFGKYILGWLVPTMATALSVGFFFTALTESALGIFVQGIWWIVSLFSGMATGGLEGSFGLNLIPRWNTVGETTKFFAQLPQLIQNRLSFIGIAVLLLVGTIVLYELRRKGIWQFNGTMLRNWKSKSEE